MKILVSNRSTQQRPFVFAMVTTLLVNAAVVPLVSAQTPPTIRKVAFIVAVSKYQKDGLPNLSFAAKDGTDVAKKLESHGFQVEKLIGAQATKKNVTDKLNAFFGKTRQLNKNDIVLLSFSGHGVQKDILIRRANKPDLVETPFFCVFDTQ